MGISEFDCGIPRGGGVMSEEKKFCGFCHHEAIEHGCFFNEKHQAWTCKNTQSSMSPNHYMHSVEAAVTQLLKRTYDMQEEAHNLYELALEIEKRTLKPKRPYHERLPDNEGPDVVLVDGKLCAARAILPGSSFSVSKEDWEKYMRM